MTPTNRVTIHYRTIRDFAGRNSTPLVFDVHRVEIGEGMLSLIDATPRMEGIVDKVELCDYSGNEIDPFEHIDRLDFDLDEIATVSATEPIVITSR